MNLGDDFLSKVKWLHVGLTSKCNASCPGCPRNNKGFGLIKDLQEIDLNFNRLVEVLSMLPSCETVQLCGNLGDPIAAKNIDKVVDFLIDKRYKIQIHTNGSIKNETWWKSFGKKLSKVEHKVFFAIDGLKDTHNIYRQGTNWDKIISNATAFIGSNGVAIWYFIPYKFNEHQILDCLKLSQKLKFKKFYFEKNPREIDEAFHYKTGERYLIENWSNFKSFQENVNYHGAKNATCMHLEYPSLYLTETGKLSVCCFMSTIEYSNSIDIAYELKNSPREICKESCKFK